jgi:nitrogen fixation protein NifX
MKVAFATRDGAHVNEQLRRSPQLVVYDVTASRQERTSVFAFDAQDRTDERIRAIAGSAIVFVTAIGPSAAARLASHGIRAATAPAGTRILDLLSELRRMLAPQHLRARAQEGPDGTAMTDG